MASTTSLTPDVASRFAALALGHVTREYPNKLDHVLNGPDDLRGPRELHPIFFGSFDWHSCVHGYWLLATLLRLFPEMPEARQIHALFDAQLMPEKVSAETEYLRQPLRATFERPYGWAWVLMLAAELSRNTTGDGERWSDTLRPLTDAFVERFIGFLPKATYPVRAGTHFNTGFALVLALEYAHVTNDERLRGLLRAKAVEWYGHDVDCQAWEPSGDDFLSPALVEAECMRRALDAEEFLKWMSLFLPRLVDKRPSSLFVPAMVSDRSDGKIAHLDGLNLSRAWCWRLLSEAWSKDDLRRPIAIEVAQRHLESSLSHVADDYMGEHWLATFALLALRD